MAKAARLKAMSSERGALRRTPAGRFGNLGELIGAAVFLSSVHRSCTDQGTSSRGHAANGFRTIKNREQSLVTDAMVLLSKTLHASWSIGLAAALVAAIPPGRMARAENIVGGAFVAESCRTREEKNATGFADSRYQTIAATAPFSPRKPGNKACQNGPKATNAPNINWVFLQ